MLGRAWKQVYIYTHTHVKASLWLNLLMQHLEEGYNILKGQLLEEYEESATHCFSHLFVSDSSCNSTTASNP